MPPHFALTVAAASQHRLEPLSCFCEGQRLAIDSGETVRTLPAFLRGWPTLAVRGRASAAAAPCRCDSPLGLLWVRDLLRLERTETPLLWSELMSDAFGSASVSGPT